MPTSQQYAQPAVPGALLKPQQLRWRTSAAWQWKTPAHINVLEAHALLTLVKARARNAGHIRRRYFHLLDSGVTLAIHVKGRTSSEQMARPLRRTNALLLASFGFPMLGFCTSQSNPSDAPSRWGGQMRGPR